MKIVIAPDKFKGSLTSREVCDNLAAGLQRSDPSVEITSLPMADGGDGFATILKTYHNTETILCPCEDPLGRPIQATYEWDKISETAIVELAVSSGLILLSSDERDPMQTSTYGTGLIIKHAINKGAKRILLGLGGSATNDGGMGILQALGFKFFDNNTQIPRAAGKFLTSISRIEPPPVLPILRFDIACDVTNPLYGSNGAAVVYAPQKGADAAAVRSLDQGLQNLNAVLRRQTGADNAQVPGTGAAGGIAAGLMAFFSVDLNPGIEIVARAAGLKAAVENADYVITGEGQLDAQSSSGKVAGYVAQLAIMSRKPVLAFAGRVTLEPAELAGMGFTAAFSISDHASSLEDSIRNAANLLQNAAFDWLSSLRTNPF